MSDEPRPDWDGIRERFIGLDESFSVKSYYPQLRRRLKELEENRAYLEQKSAALLNLLEDFEAERRKAIENEARLKAVFENLPFALWAADASGSIVLANESAAARYGMVPGAAIGDLPFGGEVRGFLTEDFFAALSGAAGNSERRIEADGRGAWIQAISAPIVADGSVRGVLGADIDVSRLKQAEESLSAMNEQLETKVQERTEQLRAKVAQLRDTQDRLVMSEKLAALGRLAAGLAHELNSPLGAIESSSSMLADSALSAVTNLGHLLERLPKDAVPVLFSLIAETLPSAERLADGDRKHKRELASRLRGAGASSPDHLAELIDEMDAYARVESLIERFGIETAASLFEAASSLVTLVRSSLIIRHAADRASVVVKALRSFDGGSLDEADSLGRFADSSGAAFPVDVDAGLSSALELYRSRLRGGIEVKLLLAAGDARARGDEAALGQAWRNIIGNALQAMEYRGTLEISSSVRGEEILVEIADSGPGIPESIGERVFEPFFTTKPVGEGNGFGLVVAKRVVERCGGSIAFESKPGRTVFRVRLPTFGMKGETP